MFHTASINLDPQRVLKRELTTVIDEVISASINLDPQRVLKRDVSNSDCDYIN